MPKKISQQFKNWQQDTNKRGFTLIELLVAISIVAILSTVGLVAYSTAQRSARDSKRKQDLKAIATAAQLYFQENGKYPNYTGTSWIHSDDTINTPWITNLTSEYIGTLPIDPVANGGQPWAGQYGYVYYGGVCASHPAGTWFLVAGLLESSNDKQSIGTKDVKWCDGGGLRSTHGWNPNVYAINSQ